MNASLGWGGIIRLGLVQAALGAIVVVVTSTMNRVMVVELGFPALLPGALVALHYGIQILRPRLGYGSDRGRRRTPWILGGMAVLVCGGIGAGLATCWMASNAAAGIVLAVVAFAMVGLGVGSCGTALLVLLSLRVAPARRAAAATVVWVMMIAGIAITATFAGRLLEPFSLSRLLMIITAVGGIAMVLTVAAVWRIEGQPAVAAVAVATEMPFRQALAQIWGDAQARRFTLFVFVSMFAYSAQELILEPFLGAVFHLTPGESTAMTGLQHGGVLAGMILVAVATTAFAGSRVGAMRSWTVGGCLCSAVAILGLAAAGWTAAAWSVRPALFILGITNGAFAVSAIGAMMGLAHAGRDSRAGTRMGLWGAAQALAFGLGGLVGTSATDIGRALLGTPDIAYAAVLIGEAALFLVAATQAVRVFGDDARPAHKPSPLKIGATPLPRGG
jgi:BCD family chlorophyll transporter-like MFS transporter